MNMLSQLGKLLTDLVSRLQMDAVTRLGAVLLSYLALVLSPIVDIKSVLRLFTKAFATWNQDRAPQLAAGLAYYAVFALAPSLIIIIAVAGLVVESKAVQEAIFTQVKEVIGLEGAEVINTTMQNILQAQSSLPATLISIAATLFGVAALLGHVQISLNVIWDVQPKIEPGLQGVLHWLRRTVVSFIVVLSSGFLLVVFLVLNTVLTVLNSAIEQLSDSIGVFDLLPIGQLTSTLLAFAMTTVLFAVVYRALPDTYIAWGDVGVGAAVTAGLFLIGQTLIGNYIAGSGIGSIYGAAGSLVVLLVWVYYSAMIFLYGAELTKVYAYMFGSRRAIDEDYLLTSDVVHVAGAIDTENETEEIG